MDILDHILNSFKIFYNKSYQRNSSKNRICNIKINKILLNEDGTLDIQAKKLFSYLLTHKIEKIFNDILQVEFPCRGEQRELKISCESLVNSTKQIDNFKKLVKDCVNDYVLNYKHILNINNNNNNVVNEVEVEIEVENNNSNNK